MENLLSHGRQELKKVHKEHLSSRLNNCTYEKRWKTSNPTNSTNNESTFREEI